MKISQIRINIILLFCLFGGLLRGEYVIQSQYQVLDSECTMSIDIMIQGNAGPFKIEIYSADNLDQFLYEETELDEGNYSYSIDLEGNYYVQIYDSFGCDYLEELIIECPTCDYNMYINNPSMYLADCDGNDGEIRFNLGANGGVSPYTYKWSTGSTDLNLMNLTEGTYVLTITDADGCADERKYVLIAENSSTISEYIIVNTCPNEETGEILLSMTQDYSNYNFVWSTGDIGPGISNLGSGIYSVTITNLLSGCVREYEFEVLEKLSFGPLTILSHEVKRSCPNEDNGSITLNVAGGVLPRTIIWSNGVEQVSNRATFELKNLKKGIYKATIIDACGNEKIKNFNVRETKLNIDQNILGVACANEGVLDINVTGTYPPFTYNWSTGETTQDLFGLSSSDYSVTVTDSEGCTNEAIFNVETSGYEIVGETLPCEGLDDGVLIIEIINPNNEEVSLYVNDFQVTSQDVVFGHFVVNDLSTGSYSISVSVGDCFYSQDYFLAEENLVVAYQGYDDFNDLCNYADFCRGTPIPGSSYSFPGDVNFAEAEMSLITCSAEITCNGNPSGSKLTRLQKKTTYYEWGLNFQNILSNYPFINDFHWASVNRFLSNEWADENSNTPCDKVFWCPINFQITRTWGSWCSAGLLWTLGVDGANGGNGCFTLGCCLNPNVICNGSFEPAPVVNPTQNPDCLYYRNFSIADILRNYDEFAEQAENLFGIEDFGNTDLGGELKIAKDISEASPWGFNIWNCSRTVFCVPSMQVQSFDDVNCDALSNEEVDYLNYYYDTQYDLNELNSACAPVANPDYPSDIFVFCNGVNLPIPIGGYPDLDINFAPEGDSTVLSVNQDTIIKYYSLDNCQDIENVIYSEDCYGNDKRICALIKDRDQNTYLHEFDPTKDELLDFKLISENIEYQKFSFDGNNDYYVVENSNELELISYVENENNSSYLKSDDFLKFKYAYTMNDCSNTHNTFFISGIYKGNLSFNNEIISTSAENSLFVIELDYIFDEIINVHTVTNINFEHIVYYQCNETLTCITIPNSSTVNINGVSISCNPEHYLSFDFESNGRNSYYPLSVNHTDAQIVSAKKPPNCSYTSYVIYSEEQTIVFDTTTFIVEDDQNIHLILQREDIIELCSFSIGSFDREDLGHVATDEHGVFLGLSIIGSFIEYNGVLLDLDFIDNSEIFLINIDSNCELKGPVIIGTENHDKIDKIFYHNEKLLFGGFIGQTDGAYIGNQYLINKTECMQHFISEIEIREFTSSVQTEVGGRSSIANPINIVPNPFFDRFTVNSISLEIERINIYDIHGVRIQSQSCHSNYVNVELDNTLQGVFFVSIFLENGEFVIKKIVKN